MYEERRYGIDALDQLAETRAGLLMFVSTGDPSMPWNLRELGGGIGGTMDPADEGRRTLMTRPPDLDSVGTTVCSGGQQVGTATILIVDDERKIRDLVRSYLEREGYAVLVADTGQRALETLERARPDLLVLDLMLPDLSGEEIARAVRSHSSLPIIMLTAKAAEDDRVTGLRLGADDYLVKPFSPRELVARVEAVLRRSGASANPFVSFDHGAMTIDRDAREVMLQGHLVELTRSEFDLLFALASHPGRVFSRFELITKVQGYDYEGYERTIDAHVMNLRRKLGEDPKHPRYVLTVTGVGYKFGVRADA